MGDQEVVTRLSVDFWNDIGQILPTSKRVDGAAALPCGVLI